MYQDGILGTIRIWRKLRLLPSVRGLRQILIYGNEINLLGQDFLFENLAYDIFQRGNVNNCFMEIIQAEKKNNG